MQKVFPLETRNFTYWIGVSDFNQNGWQNVDDGSLTTYFSWASGEPGNLTSANGCVSVDLNGRWYNDHCFNDYPSVCEFNKTDTSSSWIPANTTTPAGPITTTNIYYPVLADIVFIFDISTAISSAQFQDSRTFILNALNQFNVGYQKGAQVGLFSIYGDDDGFALQVSSFNGISDYNSLGNALNNAYPDDAAGSGSGQKALIQALKLVIAPQFKGAGYRNTTQNHLIVYITTNSVPIQSAIDEAGVILNDGSYKIIAISYQGDGSNTNALQQLVGNNTGCVLSSATADDYTGNFAQSFADKLLNANK